jgi:hypothetical protein
MGCCLEASFDTGIGLGYVGDELVLFAGIAERLIFFPPADRADLFSRLPAVFDSTQVQRLRRLEFSKAEEAPGPMGVLIDQRLVIAPAVMIRGSVAAPVLLFPPDGSPSRLLFPVATEEFERQAGMPNAIRLHLRAEISLPESDTGRARPPSKA